MAVFTAVGFLIPDATTQEIDNSVIYFLSYIYTLNGIFDVKVIMTCLLVLVDFYTSLGIFYLLHWVIKNIR
jgi:hypothetical protein